MKCSYCHNEGQTTTSKTFMSLAQLRDIVTQAIPFGLVKVRLTGGEPLLHKHCIAMLELLKCDLEVAHCWPKLKWNYYAKARTYRKK